MSKERQYSFLDRVCLQVDNAIRALTNHPHSHGQINPAAGTQEEALTDKERRYSASLMRINHAGEICAQGLYHGQALVSRQAEVQEKMQAAAIEEGDHLNWCKDRLDELNSHVSYLNPVWYAGSFLIGVGSGLLGDKWSLGFVAETEKQVVAHLDSHLEKLPVQDQRSLKIIERMKKDEDHHREEAIAAGAMQLPRVIQGIMQLTSKIMVKTAYWI